MVEREVMKMKKYKEPTQDQLEALRKKAERQHQEDLCKTWGVDNYKEACKLSQEMTDYLNRWKRD